MVTARGYAVLSAIPLIWMIPCLDASEDMLRKPVLSSRRSRRTGPCPSPPCSLWAIDLAACSAE